MYAALQVQTPAKHVPWLEQVPPPGHGIADEQSEPLQPFEQAQVPLLVSQIP